MTDGNRRAFRGLLVNSLLSGTTTTFVWFALTFWVYLETRSVVATAVLGGAFSLLAAFLGMAFGTYVDRHRKRTALLVGSAGSLLSFSGAAAVYVGVGADDVLQLTSPWFWVLVALTLGGAVVGQIRNIALSTCVSLLVPEGERVQANGQVGMITGVGFAVTSVFSGLVVGGLGMGWAYGISVVAMAIVTVHMLGIHLVEPPIEAASDQPRIDVRGALSAIRTVPGLMLLILFAAMNNVLGGVFMSLMDAYGLSMVSVEAWGALWGVLSLGFIVGGLVVSRRGLFTTPLRMIVVGNLVNWAICSVFAVRSSIVLLAVGMFVWLTMIPVIEAAEQTVLQQTIPFESQGRVFGFAQMVENAASPMSSFLIGPIAEILFIPTMTDGRGADLIGDWFGTGPERGIAVLFTLAGLAGVVGTVWLRGSRSYRRLAAHTLSLESAAVGVA